MMIRLSYTAWFTAAVSLLGLIGSATIAIQVSVGAYPPWAAWPGFLVGLLPLLGGAALAHDTRHASRADDKRNLHLIGGS